MCSDVSLITALINPSGRATASSTWRRPTIGLMSDRKTTAKVLGDCLPSQHLSRPAWRHQRRAPLHFPRLIPAPVLRPPSPTWQFLRVPILRMSNRKTAHSHLQRPRLKLPTGISNCTPTAMHIRLTLTAFLNSSRSRARRGLTPFRPSLRLPIPTECCPSTFVNHSTHPFLIW